MDSDKTARGVYRLTAFLAVLTTILVILGIATLGFLWFVWRYPNPNQAPIFGEGSAVSTYGWPSLVLAVALLAVLAGQIIVVYLLRHRKEGLKTPRRKLTITKGRYWVVDPRTGEVKESDVTETLNNLVLDNQLRLDNLYQFIFEGRDPLSWEKKTLTIDYSHGNRRFSVTVPENTILSLPFAYEDYYDFV